MKQYQIFDTRLCQDWVAFSLLLLAPALLFGQADSVEVNALNSEAGMASLYTLEFTLTDTLYSDAEFEVTFPADFDVSDVSIAGSKSINGGFAVEVEGQKVLLKRKGRGVAKLPGEQVDIMFSTVTNPTNPNVTHEIDLIVKSSQETSPTRELTGSVLIADKKVP